MSFRYEIQPNPGGLAQAFTIGRDFVGSGPSALVLGDNIFYGQGFQPMLLRSTTRNEGATVFAYPVKDPQRYGVVSFDEAGRPVKIVEKPKEPESHFAVTGLYFYDNRVTDIAANLKPSPRGELEITDVNRIYLEQGGLNVERFTRGFAWFDTGTPESLIQAANFVETVESRQGLKISCPEEIAWRMGFIDEEQLLRLAGGYPNAYGTYLREIVDLD